MFKGKNSQAAAVKQMMNGTQKHYADGSQNDPGRRCVVHGDRVDAGDAKLRRPTGSRGGVEGIHEDEGRNRTNPGACLNSRSSRGFEAVIRGTFGNSADVLKDFGLTPRRAPTPRTAEQKAVAAAKRVATRAARHTMGKNQKKDVKGAVSATLVVTPSADSTPVASRPVVQPVSRAVRRPPGVERQRAERHEPARHVTGRGGH